MGSMGSGKSNTKQTTSYNDTQTNRNVSGFNQGVSGSSQTTFDPRSREEASILGQYQDLGTTQQAFLANLMDGSLSPYTMNQGDQDLINQVFNASKDRLMTGGQEYADYLATTRGLNKSDTPVSLQAMDRFGMSLKDLEASRAQSLLDYGMQGTAMRLQGAQALPAGLGAAFLPMMQERMAGGKMNTSQNQFGSSFGDSRVTGSGTSRSDSRNVSEPSTMDQIGKGLQLGAGAAMMVGGAMTGNPLLAMGGMGMIGGGGGNPFLTSVGSGGGGGGVGSAMAGRGMGSGARWNSNFGDPRYG